MGAVTAMLSLARDLRRAYRYRRPYVTLLYRGIYATFAQARQHLPQQDLQGFDHDVVVDYFEREETGWRYLDYPAAFWLREAFLQEDRLIDLGGGWGQTYYAYRAKLTYPPRLQWKVYDVAHFLTRGKEVAAERGEERLSFCRSLAECGSAGILLAGGALQYMAEDLSDLVDTLEEKPKYLLPHHIPMYEGEDYYTIQRMHHSYVVYRVMNRDNFIRRICAKGYTLRDSWQVPRAVDVMFHPGRRVSHYAGFYFTLD